MTRWLRILAVLSGVACLGSPAMAEIPWKSPTYHLEAVRQPLDELLRQFGADQGISVVVSEKVTGTVSGTFSNLPPAKFLDRITSANGLIWYYDGSSIFVYRSDEVSTAMFTLRVIKPAKVRESLNLLGITWTPTSLKILEDDSIIYAIGPPRYLELVAQTIETLESVATVRTGGEYETQVFPLKYAWAADQTFFFTDTRVVVPGVATTLQALEQQQQQGNNSLQQPPGTTQTQNTLTKLKGQGLIAAGRPPMIPNQGAAINMNGPPPPGGTRPLGVPPPPDTVQDATAIGTAYITADTRLNAVVVRDLREKMIMYKTVIAQLDQPVGLVQISASIIDVDRDYSFEFGPPYNFGLQDNAGDFVQFNLGITPGDTPNLVATLMKNGATRFLGQMRALEAAGRANVVSQPTVLTLNNVEAALSATDTFFVRVAGNREVDLFNVAVGITLRIVPHIVDENGERKVKLVIRVEDGSLRDQQVDAIPVVRRSSINTQAVLHDEESLLIGGLYNERDVQVDRGIPLLSRIPKVGFLFRNIETERRRSERLVLITPRIVELDVNQNLPLPADPVFPIPIMTQIPQPYPRGYPPLLHDDKVAPAPALSQGLFVPPAQLEALHLHYAPPDACPPAFPAGELPAANFPDDPELLQPLTSQPITSPVTPVPEAIPPRMPEGMKPEIEVVPGPAELPSLKTPAAPAGPGLPGTSGVSQPPTVSKSIILNRTSNTPSQVIPAPMPSGAPFPRVGPSGRTADSIGPSGRTADSVGPSGRTADSIAGTRNVPMPSSTHRTSQTPTTSVRAPASEAVAQRSNSTPRTPAIPTGASTPRGAINDPKRLPAQSIATEAGTSPRPILPASFHQLERTASSRDALFSGAHPLMQGPDAGARQLTLPRRVEDRTPGDSKPAVILAPGPCRKLQLEGPE